MKQNDRRDFVRSSDANSGLRAGFVRDTRPDYSRDIKPLNKPEQVKDNSREQAAKVNTADAGKEYQKEPAREPA